MDSRKSRRSTHLTRRTYSAAKEAVLTTFHQSRFLPFLGRNIKKALKLANIFLPISAIISSLIAIHLLFPYKMTYDTTALFEIAESMHRFGLKEIFNWIYPPATQIFPDLIVTYTAYFFSQDYKLIATIIMVAQVCVMLAGAFYFFKVTVAPSRRRLAYSLTFACMALALWLQLLPGGWYGTITFYPISDSIHYCAFILALPISGLCIAWLGQGGKMRIFLLGTLLFLASLSSLATLPFITAPLLIYLAYYFLKFGRRERKASLFAGITALFTSLAGALAAKPILPSNSSTAGHPIIDTNFSMILERLHYIDDLFFIFETIKNDIKVGDIKVTLVISILLIFLGVFLYQCLQKSSDGVQDNVNLTNRGMINTFFIITLLVLFVLVLLLPGIYPDITTSPSFMNLRYFNIIYIWAVGAFVFSVATMYRRKYLVNLLICAFSLFIIISSLSNLPQKNCLQRNVLPGWCLKPKLRVYRCKTD